MLLTKPIALVKDQPLREEAINPENVYGPQLVQRMGMHKKESVRNRSQKNGMWNCGLNHTGHRTVC
jgi:hypothetical protein